MGGSGGFDEQAAQDVFWAYDPVVVSSGVEVYSLVAVSFSGALPRRILISAAWSARWLQF